MTTTNQDIPTGQFDTKLLAGLITEFNIARRNSRSYPSGHPLIEASLNKLIVRYAELMGLEPEFSIGVARDTLLFGTTTLDKNNPVFRGFAKVLFQCGIGALRFTPGLNSGELTSFLDILDMKRDEIIAAGGIDSVWQKSGIESLTICPIRYDLFTASEGVTESDPDAGATGGLWNQFARELLDGNTGNGDVLQGDMDPELMAAMLNRRYKEEQTNGQATGCGDAFADLLQQTALDPTADTSAVSDNLVRFVSNLTPALQRQLLRASFRESAQADTALTAYLDKDITADAVQNVLDEISSSDLKVSPIVVKLLQKLSLQTPHRPAAAQAADIENEEARERMHTILREQALEVYVPSDYQRKLNSLVASHQIPNLQSDEIEPLLASIESHQVESHISAILLELIATDDDPEECKLLAKSLSDMGGYFLQTGDYADYLSILDQANDPTKPESFRQIILERCTERDCLEEILNGLHVWGKPRYDQIKNLIWKIGTPFVEPLLSHLADEENLSLRRFLMERLSEFGPALREPIMARLHDSRWYFLRNLIILLKDVQNPEVIAALRPLVRHPHPRVRQEAFKTLLLCRDSAAERQVLRDLESDNRELKIAALHLVEATRPPLAFNRLLQMLGQGGLSVADVEIKGAVVKVLGEYGRADALPELARVLFSWNLLHAKQLSRLKLEITASLERYPLVTVQMLLQKTAAGSDDVARKAAEVLRSMTKGKTS